MYLCFHAFGAKNSFQVLRYLNLPDGVNPNQTIHPLGPNSFDFYYDCGRIKQEFITKVLEATIEELNIKGNCERFHFDSESGLSLQEVVNTFMKKVVTMTIEHHQKQAEQKGCNGVSENKQEDESDIYFTESECEGWAKILNEKLAPKTAFNDYRWASKKVDSFDTHFACGLPMGSYVVYYQGPHRREGSRKNPEEYAKAEAAVPAYFYRGPLKLFNFKEITGCFMSPETYTGYYPNDPQFWRILKAHKDQLPVEDFHSSINGANGNSGVAGHQPEVKEVKNDSPSNGISGVVSPAAAAPVAASGAASTEKSVSAVEKMAKDGFGPGLAGAGAKSPDSDKMDSILGKPISVLPGCTIC